MVLVSAQSGTRPVLIVEGTEDPLAPTQHQLPILAPSG